MYDVTRVLVYGGREFNDYVALHKVLHALQPLRIGHGDARGADRLGGRFAREALVPCDVYPADWDRYGKRAGFLRNQQMLREFKPTLAVECPGGRGTAHMRSLLDGAGVPVVEVGA